MKYKRSFITVLVIFCSFILSCSTKEEEPKAGRPGHEMVSGHTSGTISCEGPVTLYFTEDIVDGTGIDVPLEESPFIFDPKIEGTSIWINSRVLEFRPKERLPAGRDYRATVILSQLMETVKGSETFTFDFTTMEQAFEITIDGLKAPDPEDISLQELGGKIITADFAEDADVEEMFMASQNGKDLDIGWTHEDDGKEHYFVIEDIRRKDSESEVLIRWDGKPIGVNKKGERVFELAPLGSFKVLQVRAVNGDTQYIEVRFSDPIKKDQNLSGLIRADNRNDLRFSVENNIIMVYSATNWSGEVDVKVETGIRNVMGYRLEKPFEMKVSFERIKPQVRFVGKGVIIPTTQGLTIPIEAVNIRAVIIEAKRIYEDNMPQFLQVNNLQGEREFERVGRVVWRKLIPLEILPNQENQWIRYGLDVSSLSQANPGGLFNITLSFKRNHIVYDCADSEDTGDDIIEETDLLDEYEDEESGYRSPYDLYPDYNYWEYYQQRKNPCHPAYFIEYHDHDVSVSRNVLISDIGLIAKKGENNELFIAATDIRTSQPLGNVNISVLDYQQQEIISGKTREDGTIILSCERQPFLIIAHINDQTGYLKCDNGSALSVSHFDVSGAALKKGIKGFIYGERGVWRPGDTIYLTFILMDPDNRIPQDHPVSLELLNPKGQVVHAKTMKRSQNGFQCFKLDTEDDCLTGNWKASIKVGGATFEKVLKIETIMPNRLKIALDFGTDETGLTGNRIVGKLSSTWLHGAVAKDLKADVKLKLYSRKTVFTGYEGYSFDDPARKYEPESHDIFEGTLDKNGVATIKANIRAKKVSPGALTANFTTRVFEPGGAFSVDQFNLPYHPFDRYIGVSVPKGDKTRGRLPTDTIHTVRIAALTPHGSPVKEGKVEIEMYKISWRWWWQRGEESLAAYMRSSSYRAIKKETVEIKDGSGEWKFEIKSPSWGRYLIRARDPEGGHITGDIVYIGSPVWSSMSMGDAPDGATVLSFSSDKDTYNVGEKVVLTIPTGQKGRGLIGFETGSGLLRTEWFEAGEETTRFEFVATEDMTPNVYVHVTFMQPHLQTENDLPIRMYGVIPVKVTDPETIIKPKVSAPEVLIPDETAVIKVKEETGRPMTYTLAIVDEGLLDLTRFETPDPWNYFYSREALGVKTWDLFDFVAGAYGGSLEKMLAIGGDSALTKREEQKANRFPPMVRFLGPFDLEEDEIKSHEIDIPQYVGSVRIMAVAGHERAFGFDQKTAFVRKPLMVLGTLPRVLGPEEEVELPVSVFALEKDVRDVSVSVTSGNELLSIEGPSEKEMSFSEPGDDVVYFRLRAGNRPGVASVRIRATGNGEEAEQSIELDIRMPGGPVAEVTDGMVNPNETWEQDITFIGTAGTNEALLEVSRIPPLNLGRRMQYLIRYPHGCVEQVTSSVFPQVYLDKLVDLSPAKEDEIQRNIKAGIERLRSFQTSEGGFAYWPGSGEADDWASTYAGHFLVEAEKAGYFLPSGLLGQWKRFQRDRARSWIAGSTTRSELIQAYRLYSLSLANAADLSAMNRLREQMDDKSVARWILSAAYQLAGQGEAARDLTRSVGIDVEEYRELSNTYGSHIRDKAMILEALSLMGRMEEAGPLVQEISKELGSAKWLSTQTTAYSLIAMARYAGVTGDVEEMGFDFAWGEGRETSITSGLPVYQMDLKVGEEGAGRIRVVNRGETVLYPRVIVHGIPPVGSERSAENGLSISVKYLNTNGDEIDPVKLEQGTDFVAEVSIKNTGRSGIYEEVALTHIFPSGWEIHNTRMDLTGDINASEFEYQDIRDDRIYTYFDIDQGKEKKFSVLLNASYLGRFYLPMVRVEAMYDENINALVPGQWMTIETPGLEQ